jgi:hypothetical protein
VVFERFGCFKQIILDSELFIQTFSCLYFVLIAVAAYKTKEFAQFLNFDLFLHFKTLAHSDLGP